MVLINQIYFNKNFFKTKNIPLTDGKHIYHGDHFAMYRTTELPRCAPGANTGLQVSYTSVNNVHIRVWVHESPKWVAQGERIRLPMQDSQVVSLGQEDPLEEEMATHSNFLPGKTQWTEEPAGLQLVGVTKSWTELSTHTHAHTDILWMKEKGAHHKDTICMANSVLGSPQTLSHSIFRQYRQMSEQIVVHYPTDSWINGETDWER